MSMAFNLPRVIMNLPSDQLPVALIAQLVNHDTGIIAEVRVQNPNQARNAHAFFRN